MPEPKGERRHLLAISAKGYYLADAHLLVHQLATTMSLGANCSPSTGKRYAPLSISRTLPEPRTEASGSHELMSNGFKSRCNQYASGRAINLTDNVNQGEA